MTATEKWNKIVEYYNKYYRASENIVQSIWESVFAEFLGYSRLEGEIERHRNIQIGSTERVIADIIIKDGNTDLFVVELKQHNLPYVKSMETQLISYLKQLRNNTGILICSKIYIFDYDYSKNDDEQDRAEIEFKPDNPDGIMFIDLLCKSTYNNTAVKEFVRRQIESAKKAELIEAELTSELIRELLRDYFTDKYGAAEFEQVIKGFNITVAPKNAIFVPTYGYAKAVMSNTTNDRISSNETFSELKIGKIAQTLLREILESGKVDNLELSSMLTKDYSKSVFGIDFPLLVPADEKFDSVRYYSKPLTIHGKQYRLCSQWFEVAANNDRPFLLAWLKGKGIEAT
jgi:hypothetical protein